MNKIAAVLALLLLGTSASIAGPEGVWPTEARGTSLPTADWILVIPAVRDVGGNISIWDKQHPWNQQWTVPRPTPLGTRTVAITGDSEDRRMIEGWHLDNMDMNALSRLADKYSAKAVAVAVIDDAGQSAVAGWVEGRGAAWDHAMGGGSAREASLAVMDDLFSGREGQNPVAAEGYDVTITGQRGEGAWTEYRVVAHHGVMHDVLRGVQGLDILEVESYSPLSVIVRVNDGRHVETVLTSAGIGLR